MKNSLREISRPRIWVGEVSAMYIGAACIDYKEKELEITCHACKQGTVFLMSIFAGKQKVMDRQLNIHFIK